jgi:hypothetical protein
MHVNFGHNIYVCDLSKIKVNNLAVFCTFGKFHTFKQNIRAYISLHKLYIVFFSISVAIYFGKVKRIVAVLIIFGCMNWSMQRMGVTHPS